MGNHEDWSGEWAGLEPVIPRSRPRSCWPGGCLAFSVVTIGFMAGIFLLWRELDQPLPANIVTRFPVVATSTPLPTATLTPPPEFTPLVIPTETPDLAPTATLPGSQAGDEVLVPRLAIRPVVDADFSEWADQPVYESQHRVFNDPSWDRSDDITAFWRLGWDDSGLFVAVQVDDDVHVQTQTGNQIFRGDGVSLQIDTDREGDLAPVLSPDDFQVNLSPGDFAGIPVSAYLFRGAPDGGLLDAPGNRIAIAARPNGQGYLLEALIPWEDLDVSPSAGAIMGVALNVDDNDGPGTAIQEVLKSHVATRTFADPTSWGRMILQ
jgi:hypothetical protein